MYLQWANFLRGAWPDIVRTEVADPPPGLAPGEVEELEGWPVLDDEPEREDEIDSRRLCHLSFGGALGGGGNMCGRPGPAIGSPNAVWRNTPRPNFEGPICDGPHGCSAPRCQLCVAIWKGGHS